MNFKTLITFSLLILCIKVGYSQKSKTEHEDVVVYFKECIKNTDVDKLDLIISYPIKRPYPIPPIKNKQELKNRYLELFDDSLTKVINNSSVKTDWTDVGWRGIMLHNGLVWLDYDGKFITTNHTSKKEKSIEQKWINYERNLLHTKLKNFKKPVYTIETDKFIVRIDLLENENYRYASWSKGSKISDQPDLIIKNGELIYDGSGGNHYFTFSNGDYQYIVYKNELGSFLNRCKNTVFLKVSSHFINYVTGKFGSHRS